MKNALCPHRVCLLIGKETYSYRREWEAQKRDILTHLGVGQRRDSVKEVFPEKVTLKLNFERWGGEKGQAF